MPHRLQQPVLRYNVESGSGVAGQAGFWSKSMTAPAIALEQIPNNKIGKWITGPAKKSISPVVACIYSAIAVIASFIETCS